MKNVLKVSVFFICYDFILFNQPSFLRINFFVWRKRFYRYLESFIVSYIFFVQTTIIFFPSFSYEWKSNFVVYYNFLCFLQFFIWRIHSKVFFLSRLPSKVPHLLKENDCLPQTLVYVDHGYQPRCKPQGTFLGQWETK